MDLRINQQFGLIGLDMKEPAFDLEVRHPQSELEISPPEIAINQKLPRLEIDQTECFADMNRRTPVEFSRYMAELDRIAGLRGIASIAGEGDMLAAIEEGIDIADIAFMNSQKHDEFDVGCVPEHRPVIDVIVEDLRINVEPGSVAVNLRAGQVFSALDWGRVGIHWQQKPEISIEYIGRRVDVNG